jgi:hypothetical protein
MYGEEVFVSHYIPWQNVYQYGEGVEPPSAENGFTNPLP